MTHRRVQSSRCYPGCRPTGLGDGQPTLPTPRASRSPVANDKHGRLALCKYILRPPLANDRLKILDDGDVRLDGHCDGNPGRVPKPSRDGAR
jgi:hypothetical protein